MSLLFTTKGGEQKKFDKYRDTAKPPVETPCHTGTATLYIKFRANNTLLDVTLSNSNITRHNIRYTSHASLRPLALHLTHETLALKIFHDG